MRENGIQGTGWTNRWIGPGPLNREFVALREHVVTIDLPGLRTQEFVAKAQYNRTCSGLICITDPSSGTMTYEPKPGTYGKLEPADVSPALLVMGGDLYAEDGDFQTAYDPNEYLLTLTDGSQWWIDQAAGRLFQVRDINGNVVQFSGNQIVHSDGRGMRLVRDGQNRVTEINDGTGRLVKYGYDDDGNLARVTDPGGNTTRYSYDASHYLISILDPRGVKALRVEYDSAGRVIRQISANKDTVRSVHDLIGHREVTVNPKGDSTAYGYDARGNVVQKTVNGHSWYYAVDAQGHVTRTDNPDGTHTTAAFDAMGNEIESVDAMGRRTTRSFQVGTDRLTSETDPLGRTRRYQYDGRGNLVRSIGPDGRVQTAQEFDSKGNLIADTAASGEVVRYQYDANGNRLTQVDGLGRTTRWAYDSRGQVTLETDALGRITRHSYDVNGNRISTTAPDGRVSRTEYTSFGKPLVVTDALGRKTTTQYDATGQAIATFRPEGVTTFRRYDASGNVIASTDALGRMTRMRYDAEGHLQATTFADSVEVGSEYDVMGRRIASIDARGSRTEFEYDAAGRDTLVRDAMGNVTRSRYDLAGRKIEVINALGQITRTSYDLEDRVTKTVYPDGSFDSSAYDLGGRKVASVDALLRKTKFEYDAVGQLVAVVDPSGQITRYGYDGVGNRVRQTDANGHETMFRFDALNRLVAKIYPDNAVDSLEYDAAGQLVRQLAPNGESTRYEYDSLGREVKRTYASGRILATSWNLDGTRASVLDDRGQTRYDYDARGRLVSVANPDGVVLAYGYGRSGQVERRTTPWGETRYVVNALGQVDTVLDRRAGVVTYQYDALGRPLAVKRPNGVTSAYGYTAKGLVETLTHKVGTEPVASFRYRYDASGLRIGAEESFGIASPVLWSHDLNQRLVGETRSGTTQSWSYDPASNRTSQSQSGPAQTATFDARDRLTTLGNATYTWDLSGRLRARSQGSSLTRYQWQDHDRLTQVETPTGTVRYAYDDQGLLVSRTDVSGTERFTWDGTLPYGQMVAATNASGTLKSREVWGVEHLAEVRNDTVLWLLTDGLGNVRAIADSVGKVVGRQDFDAWGNRTTDSGRTVRFGYRGEWSDAATGLVYLRARWMDPMTGRFLSEDPYEGAIDNVSSLNRYLYAGQTPVNMVDPNGRMGIGECLVVLAGVSILSAIVIKLTIFTTDDEIQKKGEADLPLARSMVAKGISFIQSGDPAVQSFFGKDAQAGNAELLNNFNSLSSALLRKITFYRAPPKGEFVAGARPLFKDRIWLRPLYFSLSSGWTMGSRSGTIVHEVTHYELGTRDIYGVEASMALAASGGITLAAMNADNYSLFVEFLGSR